MDRLGLSPWGPLIVSTVFSVATFIAVFGFGAHPMVLIPVAIGAATFSIGLQTRAERRSGRY